MFVLFQHLVVRVRKANGNTFEFKGKHTMNENQIGWFRAGSALNMMAELQAAKTREIGH